MSHISKIELEVTDLESLERACSHIGLTLNRNQTTFKWYDGNGVCDHAIKIPGAEYEIGLIKKDGKYELQTDYWDENIAKAIGENGGLLKQRYAVEQTRTQAIRKGYRVIERQIENAVRLHVRM